jgi:hypothetical protein
MDTAPYDPTSPSSYEWEPVHDIDRARICDPGSNITVRVALLNYSSQNLQLIGGVVGPLAPDQHSDVGVLKRPACPFHHL